MAVLPVLSDDGGAWGRDFIHPTRAVCGGGESVVIFSYSI